MKNEINNQSAPHGGNSLANDQVDLTGEKRS